MNLLEIDDLRVGLRTGMGVVHALRGVSLRVEPGEVLAVVGESGCGKTVTMQTVMGLLQPDEIVYRQGRALFDGRDLFLRSEDEMRAIRGGEIAMIFQDPMTALNPTRTVGAQVIEALLAHRRIGMDNARHQALELLHRVGIPRPEMIATQYPFRLSGGMRQRVVIAAALACEPKLLIADEPTTALDVTIQAQILALLQSLQAQYGMAIILVTHNLGVVAEMAHRVAVMYAGRVVEEGAVDGIFSHPAHPYTWGLLEGLPRLDIARGEKLRPIGGLPPDLLTPHPGCPFADRCPHVMAVCDLYPPPMFETGLGHRSACFLLHPHAHVARETIGRLSPGRERQAGQY